MHVQLDVKVVMVQIIAENVKKGISTIIDIVINAQQDVQYVMEILMDSVMHVNKGIITRITIVIQQVQLVW